MRISYRTQATRSRRFLRKQTDGQRLLSVCLFVDSQIPIYRSVCTLYLSLRGANATWQSAVGTNGKKSHRPIREMLRIGPNAIENKTFFSADCHGRKWPRNDIFGSALQNLNRSLNQDFAVRMIAQKVQTSCCAGSAASTLRAVRTGPMPR